MIRQQVLTTSGRSSSIGQSAKGTPNVFRLRFLCCDGERGPMESLNSLKKSHWSWISPSVRSALVLRIRIKFLLDHFFKILWFLKLLCELPNLLYPLVHFSVPESGKSQKPTVLIAYLRWSLNKQLIALVDANFEDMMPLGPIGYVAQAATQKNVYKQGGHIHSRSKLIVRLANHVTSVAEHFRTLPNVQVSSVNHHIRCLPTFSLKGVTVIFSYN